MGATSPLALELAAQVTYPAPEGVSANLMTNVFTQLATIGFLALCALPAFPDSAVAGLMLLLLAGCVLLAMPVREVYRRSAAERARSLPRGPAAHQPEFEHCGAASGGDALDDKGEEVEEDAYTEV